MQRGPLPEEAAMSTEQRHAVDKQQQKAGKLGIRTKRDLRSDKDKSFNQKFADFVRAHPTEQEGLAAYEALPD
jgi:hypothetical protein